MTNKYYRYQPVVSGDNEDYWLRKFQEKLQKQSVQPLNDNSIYEQINSIINSKSKYPSVEAAVRDMQERSGLTAYLNKLNKSSEKTNIDKTKTANVDNVPCIIKKCPNIKSTIENIIRSTKGNLPIPAIIDKVRNIHKSDVSEGKDWEDNLLLVFINNINIEEKQKYPKESNESNLGIVDTQQINDDPSDSSNTDVFRSLTPTKF